MKQPGESDEALGPEEHGEPEEHTEALTVPAAGWGTRGGQGPGEAAGDVIGPYELLELLGEGGMGTVWLAQQSEPVKRRVALKIIKLGMDTREVVVRFEVERQALALMDHPHIAKVLDAGATQSGRPYFVMDLVRGVAITQYCDQARLGLRERLLLFTQVCQAIQHAHQKGVIHRDIKPSNVLVAQHDGEAVPKVIDFGVAKATTAELTEKTHFTRIEQVIGTLDYMAPEQTVLGVQDIDTRVDVYSLGVLLYELLTGTKPYDIKQAREAGGEEVLRTIREVDPAKPSTRLSSMGASASSLEGLGQAQSADLYKHLRGDLDWIVMKALEKDRTRRYGTASDFAADVQRYLNHEPVLAAPPSFSYRSLKLLRRRRKSVLAAAAVVLTLLAGAFGTGLGFWKTMHANRELDEALGEKARALGEEEELRRLAEANERVARQAEQLATREAERASVAEASTRQRADELEQVAAFQAQQLSALDVELMGERLRAALVAAAPGPPEELLRVLARVNFTSLALDSLRENLFERTLQAIDSEFEAQPLVHAQLLQTTANTFQDLGLFALALDPLERALGLRRRELGDEHPDTLVSIGNMGVLLHYLGRLDEAELFYREGLEVERRSLGPEHPDTLLSKVNLAGLMSSQGRFKQAETLYREVLEVQRRRWGDQHHETLDTISNLGHLLQNQGQLEEAEVLALEALEGSREVLGREHPDTLRAITNFGILLYDQRRFAEAEPYYREVLDGYRRLRGDQHPNTLTSCAGLGVLLTALGEHAEAEELLLEARAGLRQALGEEHPQTLNVVSSLGSLFKVQGRYLEAETYNREALEGKRRVLGDEHPDTLWAMNNLGILLMESGRLTEAEPLLRQALDGQLAVLGAEHQNSFNGHNSLGQLLIAQGKPELAAQHFSEALLGMRRVLGPKHPSTLTWSGNLESVLRGLVRVARATGDELAQGLALAELGEHLVQSERFEEAELRLGEALELQLATLPEGDAGPWRLQLVLSSAIAGQGRLVEAETLFLESIEWFQAHAGGQEMKVPNLVHLHPVAEDKQDAETPLSPGEGEPGSVLAFSTTNLQQVAIDFYTLCHQQDPSAGYDTKRAAWE